MKLNDKAVKAAQLACRTAWPWLNRVWADYRLEKGITDMGDMPLEPFEKAIEAYLKAAK